MCVCVVASSWQVDEAEVPDTKVDDSQVWVPAEEPIINSAFLFDTKIWEICQELPIHWIHPSYPAGEEGVRVRGGSEGKGRHQGSASKWEPLKVLLEAMPLRYQTI